MSKPDSPIEAHHRGGADVITFRDRILLDHSVIDRIDKRVHFVKESSCRHQVRHCT